MSTAVAAPSAGAPPAEERTSGRKKLIGIVVVLAVLGGAGWWFFLKPSGDTAPKPGEVVKLEPIQVNLASGHYLRLGVALQLTENAHEVDGSKALDAAIGVFSGLPVAEVNKPASREELRHELEEELGHRYHGDVMEVYFTEFVTQ
ncbi:MAG TPA: flagellar basal body-associated FliL family protein [Nocardioides sp.]|nr:flagellar basal body-associated FliL family protein [Nocardioides sp.]